MNRGTHTVRTLAAASTTLFLAVAIAAPAAAQDEATLDGTWTIDPEIGSFDYAADDFSGSWVGYRAQVNNGVLELALGFSHPIFFLPPDGITITAETVRGRNPQITIEGIDKQMVGQVAAKIRGLRPPEPYKGKGVRYVGEYVRRKAGKTAAR